MSFFGLRSISKGAEKIAEEAGRAQEKLDLEKKLDAERLMYQAIQKAQEKANQTGQEVYARYPDPERPYRGYFEIVGELIRPQYDSPKMSAEVIVRKVQELADELQLELSVETARGDDLTIVPNPDKRPR